MCAGCRGTRLYTVKLQQRFALLVRLHSRPLPSVSVFSSTQWPHLGWKQLGVEAGRRGMAGSPERGGCLREGEGGRSSGVQRAASSSSTARGGRGRAGKRGPRGPHPPQGPLGSSPSLPSRARPAAGTGKRPHSTVRESSCPGHPCQVLIET